MPSSPAVSAASVAPLATPRVDSAFCRMTVCEGLGACHLHARINPAYGEGWMAKHDFANGLSVSRGDYLLHAHYRSRHEDMACAFGMVLFLSGRFDFEMDARRGKIVARPGDVLIKQGRLGTVTATQHAHERIRCVALDVSRDLLAAWVEEGLTGRYPLLSALLAQPAAGMLHAAGSQLLDSMAARLLALPESLGAVQRLELESQALSLLLAMLGQARDSDSGALGQRQKAAVDEAVDILRAELADPPTIHVLARRVGLNECSLKRGFRVRLGTTIGGFVRGERMKFARSLLEAGVDNVEAVAHRTGYANVSQFSAAFRREFGLLPSHLLKARRH